MKSLNVLWAYKLFPRSCLYQRTWVFLQLGFNCLAALPRETCPHPFFSSSLLAPPSGSGPSPSTKIVLSRLSETTCCFKIAALTVSSLSSFDLTSLQHLAKWPSLLLKHGLSLASGSFSWVFLGSPGFSTDHFFAGFSSPTGVPFWWIPVVLVF